jgi:hypothetical protein
MLMAVFWDVTPRGYCKCPISPNLIILMMEVWYGMVWYIIIFIIIIIVVVVIKSRSNEVITFDQFISSFWPHWALGFA